MVNFVLLQSINSSLLRYVACCLLPAASCHDGLQWLDASESLLFTLRRSTLASLTCFPLFRRTVLVTTDRGICSYIVLCTLTLIQVHRVVFC